MDIDTPEVHLYLECNLVSVSKEELVAKSSSTCTMLRGDRAKGR
jgi:hypothetical protein